MISLKSNRGRDRQIVSVAEYKPDDYPDDYEETTLDRQRARRLARGITNVMKQAARELRSVDIQRSRLRPSDDQACAD